jgi:N6-adenosine-specific RNA methylase IME4
MQRQSEPFRCTVTDPPWPEKGAGKIKRGADRWYSCMKVKDIIALHLDLLTETVTDSGLVRPPQFEIAENSHLWCWTTNNYLKAGLELLDALGYRYISNSAWAKMECAELAPGVPAYFKNKPAWIKQRQGLGQYMCGEHELLLFGVRGKLLALWKDKSTGAKMQGTLTLGPRTPKHSEKPQAAYDKIANISPGPRLELFARDPRPGWTVWGNEVSET